jgi:hypothetical protein
MPPLPLHSISTKLITLQRSGNHDTERIGTELSTLRQTRGKWLRIGIMASRHPHPGNIAAEHIERRIERFPAGPSEINISPKSWR